MRSQVTHCKHICSNKCMEFPLLSLTIRALASVAYHHSSIIVIVIASIDIICTYVYYVGMLSMFTTFSHSFLYERSKLTTTGRSNSHSILDYTWNNLKKSNKISKRKKKTKYISTSLACILCVALPISMKDIHNRPVSHRREMERNQATNTIHMQCAVVS